MENNYKLGKIESIFIIAIIMISKLILNIPYYIVNLVGTGAIINIIYVSIVDFIFLLISLKLFKNFENSDILDISEFLGGKILKIIVALISIVLFFSISFITLLDFSNVLRTIYFSNFNMIYILLFFIIGILIANLSGLKSISHSISFIVPLIILSIFITFFAIWNKFDIKNLTPIFGESYHTTFIKGLSNTFVMNFIIYFYFIKPLLKNPSDFNKISIISYIVSFILLLLTTISMLTLFSAPTGNEPINSLLLLARQIELGNFLQRVDAFFIFLWIFSFFSYLSFVIFIINKIVKKITNVTNEKMISFSTCSILLGLALIPTSISQIRFIENIFYRYFVLIFMFGIGLFILLFANIKKRRKAHKQI